MLSWERPAGGARHRLHPARASRGPVTAAQSVQAAHPLDCRTGRFAPPLPLPPEASVGPVGGRRQGTSARLRPPHSGRPARGPWGAGDRAHLRPGEGGPRVVHGAPRGRSPSRGRLRAPRPPRGAPSADSADDFASWPSPWSVLPCGCALGPSSPGRSLQLGVGPPNSRGWWVLWSLHAAGAAGVLSPAGSDAAGGGGGAGPGCVTLARPRLSLPGPLSCVVPGWHGPQRDLSHGREGRV